MNSDISTVASRYHLLTPLGQGGMGVVYRAYDRLTGQTVALKQVQVARKRWPLPRAPPPTIQPACSWRWRRSFACWPRCATRTSSACWIMALRLIGSPILRWSYGSPANLA
ncbi:MAG: hypothetical protein U0350_07280 [Caldilineaceae bacterium]